MIWLHKSLNTLMLDTRNYQPISIFINIFISIEKRKTCFGDKKMTFFPLNIDLLSTLGAKRSPWSLRDASETSGRYLKCGKMTTVCYSLSSKGLVIMTYDSTYVT